MDIVSILGQKGGTGKTTIAAAMAVSAAKAGRTVAVLDLDPQATIAKWADQRGGDDVAVVSCQVGRLEHVLQTAEDNGVDLAIIDTAGSAAEPAIAAARAARSKSRHLCLLPLQPHMFDLHTLKAVKDILLIGGSPRSAVVVSRAYSAGQRHIDAADGASSQGFEVCPTVIYTRTGHGDPGNVGMTSVDLDPRGKAATEMIALYDYINMRLYN